MEINENSIVEQKKIRDLQASFDKSMKILESHIAESITIKDRSTSNNQMNEFSNWLEKATERMNKVAKLLENK